MIPRIPASMATRRERRRRLAEHGALAICLLLALALLFVGFPVLAGAA